VEVKKGQWCLLTGILPESSQPRDASIYIDGPDGEIDILVSSVAIVPASGVRIVDIEDQLDQGQRSDDRLFKEVAAGRPHPIPNVSKLLFVAKPCQWTHEQTHVRNIIRND
jgi:hypothetical protein